MLKQWDLMLVGLKRPYYSEKNVLKNSERCYYFGRGYMPKNFESWYYSGKSHMLKYSGLMGLNQALL